MSGRCHSLTEGRIAVAVGYEVDGKARLRKPVEPQDLKRVRIRGHQPKTKILLTTEVPMNLSSVLMSRKGEARLSRLQRREGGGALKTGRVPSKRAVKKGGGSPRKSTG